MQTSDLQFNTFTTSSRKSVNLASRKRLRSKSNNCNSKNQNMINFNTLIKKHLLNSSNDKLKYSNTKKINNPEIEEIIDITNDEEETSFNTIPIKDKNYIELPLNKINKETSSLALNYSAKKENPRKNNFTDKSTKVFNKTKIPKFLLLKAPWITEATLNKERGFSFLHYEILDYYNYIKPKEEENKKRLKTIEILTDIINKAWPNWEVKVFGSFPVDLHLSNSDIDIVIFKDNNSDNNSKDTCFQSFSEIEQLKLIHNVLVRKSFAKDIKIVDAKVPILKSICKETGIRLDIR